MHMYEMSLGTHDYITNFTLIKWFLFGLVLMKIISIELFDYCLNYFLIL